MTRLSYIERDDADPKLHPIYDAIGAYGPFANQVRTMAHCPPVLEHVFALLFAWREATCLSRRHIELLNVVVAKRNQCTYCIVHHAPKLVVEGLSDEGVARLLDDDDHPELNEADRLVVQYSVSGERCAWPDHRCAVRASNGPLFRGGDCRAHLAYRPRWCVQSDQPGAGDRHRVRPRSDGFF